MFFPIGFTLYGNFALHSNLFTFCGNFGVYGCILYDAFSFGILFTAISALTIYEFGQLVNMRAEGVKINKTINMLGGAYLFLAIMGFCIDAADSKIFIPYVLLLLYMMISELYLEKFFPTPKDSWVAPKGFKVTINSREHGEGRVIVLDLDHPVGVPEAAKDVHSTSSIR